MRTRSGRTIRARAWLVALLAACALRAGADAVPGMYWTHVGYAGTVDPADLPAARFRDAAIENVGPDEGIVEVNYNVVAVDGLQATPDASDGLALVVRYRDQGIMSRVYAVLQEVSLETGLFRTVTVLDSDALPSSFVYQTQQVETCGPAAKLDFTRYAYFVRVFLVRRTETGVVPGVPGVALLQIKPHVCLE
jgi:hypothetical protein